MKNAMLILSSFCLLASSLAAERGPNILILLADDLGYAGLGVTGCKDIPTPHIDSIAENGVRFTDGYATHCVCSPSRAGLMSGRYQHRFGFEHNSGPERYAAENFGLPRSEPTLAERLKAAGYATGMVGKWHIGFQEGLRPHERGFDSHYGFLSGARTYMPGKPDNDPIVRDGQPVTDEKEYLTDAFAREAVGFLERSKEKPFFLCLAFNAVHGPLEATEPYLARFPHLTGKRQIHAAMVAAMDDAVGRVLGKVRALGQEENTLVFFYSDNGGPTSQTTASNEPLRGYKGQFYEGGIRVPFLAQWKGTLPAGMIHREMVMGFDCHATALAAAGVPLPADKPLDGVDLVPFLTGQRSGRPHDHLFWRSGDKHAARVGDWKLVRERGAAPELFHLKDDIGEKTDLADKEAAKLKELQAAYDQWHRQMMPAQWVRQDGRAQDGTGRGKARAGGIEERFRQYDKDGDGKLDAAEAGTLGFFKPADTDGDGAVTREEAQAFARKSATPPVPGHNRTAGMEGDGAAPVFHWPVAPVQIPESECPVQGIEATAADGRATRAWWRKPKGDGRFPAILFIHGGLTEFPEVSLRQHLIANPVITRFLAAGYAVVMATFRTYEQDVQSRGPIEDVRAVLRQTAKLPGIDPRRIALYGGSGGGSIALELGADPAVRAIVAGEPATVLYTGMLTTGEYGPRLEIMSEPEKYLTPALRARTLEKLKTLRAPVLILHGDRHDLRKLNKPLFLPLMEEAGVRVEYREYPGYGHGFYFGGGDDRWGKGADEAVVDAVVRDVRAFLEKARSAAGHIMSDACGDGSPRAVPHLRARADEDERRSGRFNDGTLNATQP